MLAKITAFLLLFSISTFSMSLESISGSYQKHYESKKTNDHWVILGAIERIKGAVKPEEDVRLSGRLTSWLWQIPVGHGVDESFNFVKKQVSDKAITLFECQGRSCGLSNDYANQVFSHSILYGRDSGQEYWVGYEDAKKKTLWLVYSVQRSNKRVFVYAERFVLNRGQEALLDEFANKGEITTFLKRGYMVIDELGSESAHLKDEQIETVKQVLKDYPTQKFALVVHRYSKTENQRLVDQTQQEAQGLLDQVAKAGGFIQHFYAHGAGAMMPRENQSDRIELVELKNK